MQQFTRCSAVCAGTAAFPIINAHRKLNIGGVHTNIQPFALVTFDGISPVAVARMGLQPFSRVLSGLSGDVLPALKAEGEKFDMIFIDGLHSFDVTLLDLFYSHALLKVGGTLLCDDMAWWQVAQAIDVFRKHHPGYKPCDAGQPGFTPMGVKSRMACFIKDAHEDETEVDFDYEWYKEVAAEFVAINGPAFDPLANKQNPPVYAKPWGSVGGGAWGNRLYKQTTTD